MTSITTFVKNYKFETFILKITVIEEKIDFKALFELSEKNLHISEKVSKILLTTKAGQTFC